MKSRTGRVVLGRMNEVVFGRPAAAAVAELAARSGARRVLIMASGTLNRETEVVEKVRRGLAGRVATTFDQVPAHSPRDAVIAAVELARDIDADLIVTIGGGSVTDAGKAVPFCLANNIRTAEDLDALRPLRGADGALEVPAGCQPPVIRQIAVPTTLSAGEFSALSGLTDKRSRIKEIFWHPELIPASVVLDPAVTVFTPQDLFLSTGIRAVDHCVEGLCSTQANPYTDAQALHGLSLLANGLRQVKSRPSDLDARLDCQFGAWLSMAPVTSGVPMGASHGIGYVLGAAFDIPHGHTSCVMLPAVMRWNLPVTRSQQTAIAAALGGKSAEEGSALVSRLIADLGMPTRLSGLDIGRKHFRDIAEQAMTTAWVPRNPRAINGPEQVLEILELAA